MYNQKFYEELGKVIYAMAMADGEVQEEEQEVIIEMVREVLAPIEKGTDSMGTDSAFYALFSFEQEADLESDPEAAFSSFEQHLRLEKIRLSPAMKDACMQILRKIARAYGRITKAEQALLDRFESRLEAFTS